MEKIDLHMHTTISDGTDTPLEIIDAVRSAGMDLFSVTDHDAISACGTIRQILADGDPGFISGIEFSCRDEYGKYHILGYGYDSEAGAIRSIVEKGHNMRIEKTGTRLEKLRNAFGISFSEEDVRWLYANHNPGKPHIAKLMKKLGYVDSISDAFDKYLNHLGVPAVYIRPEEAIEAIREQRFIGKCGFTKIHWKNRLGELAILIGEKDFRGKGYGADAIRLLCRFGFEEMNLHKIKALVFDFNAPALRCYEKCGFVREGVLKQEIFREGAYHDVVSMALFRSES